MERLPILVIEFDSLVAATQNLAFMDVGISILCSFILGMLIAVSYRWTHRGYNYSYSFVNTIVLLPMITAIVMMVIGNNLARAFGLVGAMSIIRFRTVVKDTRDTAFVFFSLAVGMAAGTGYYIIAVPGAALVIICIFILHTANFGSIRSKEILLRMTVTPGEQESNEYLGIFKKYLKSSTLLNVRSLRDGRFLELAFFIRLKKIEESDRLVAELQRTDEVETVTLLLTGDSAEF